MDFSSPHWAAYIDEILLVTLQHKLGGKREIFAGVHGIVTNKSVYILTHTFWNDVKIETMRPSDLFLTFIPPFYKLIFHPRKIQRPGVSWPYNKYISINLSVLFLLFIKLLLRCFKLILYNRHKTIRNDFSYFLRAHSSLYFRPPFRSFAKCRQNITIPKIALIHFLIKREGIHHAYGLK